MWNSLYAAMSRKLKFNLFEIDWYSYIDEEYEWLRDFVQNPTKTWNIALTKGDERVKDWFLMQYFSPTLLLVLAYLVSIWLGKKIMTNRQPFTLKKVLFVYNVSMVLLNAHIVYEIVTCSWRLNYNYICQPVNYSYHPLEMRIAAALWWYYFSKCIEFLDTIFFVMRKKNNQVSFLHVYHHASMFPLWWLGVKYVAGGMSAYGPALNSFIHVVMYTYYGLAGLGPHMQKYLWWKKYLTWMQLGQFVSAMYWSAQSLYVGCRFTRWMQYNLVVYGGTILALFLNFYYHAYIKTIKKQAAKLAHTSTVAEKARKIQQEEAAKPMTNGESKESKKEN